MEDFVPFEIAKKLKEKGFREECLLHYESTGGFYSNSINTYDRPNQELDYSDFLKCFNVGNSMGLIDAPTISQVLKWLREEKEIDIILQPIFLYNENNREREYGIEIYAPQLNKPTHLDYFKNWGKGAVAGIEYVLDNLI